MPESDSGPLPEEPQSRLEDVRRSERTMILVRWAAVAFAAFQVLVYSTLPYPPGIEETALAMVAGLAVANVAIWLAHRRVRTFRGARALSIASLASDILITSAFVWLYAFDQLSALWAILFILPLEGAIRFGLPGALVAWAASAALYVGRELWGSGRYAYPLEWNSVSFRMGIALLIALVAGLMARDLLRQRSRATGALVELSRTDALRSRLVAMLAHDVRNPLTTIRGTLQTLSRHSDRLNEGTRRELMETADEQAARLERLAADLLDLARMERGRLDLRLEDVNLEQAVANGLRFAGAGQRFEVRVPPSLMVRADPPRLEQIVVNLAANALRHGESPFEVEAAPTEGGRVEVVFRDRGPGIAEEERPGLFEPFRTERDRSSVGLGLAIVKALAEAHGGEVTYEPNQPRGACFRVSLLSAVPSGHPVQKPQHQVPGQLGNLELGNVADPR